MAKNIRMVVRKVSDIRWRFAVRTVTDISKEI